MAVITVICASWLSALPGARPASLAGAAIADPVLAVGGDIACPPGRTVTAVRCGQGKTGALLAAIDPSYVLPLGDSQYEDASAAEYAGSYDLTGWGAHKAISRPAAGNHEYHTTGATDYYGYFGANAGDPAKGYYSWDVAGPNNSFRWHLIALNSECALLGGGSISAGCGAGSTQELWLKADLAANKNVCTIAYWHRPRFSSSSTTPSSTTYTAFWNDLYNAGADIVLNGHAHDYERFNPQTGAGVADPAKGIREFIVGTGGENFQSLGPPIANSAIANASAFGVMTLTLHANTYDWQFVPAAGYSLNDSGSATCHAPPAPDATPPSAPTNVSAAAASANQVDLAWSAATDNVGVTNYNVYRGSNGATPGLIATTTSSAASYTDTSVTASTSYTYQVQAADAAGNTSMMSSPVTVTTPASTDTTAPSPPSGLASETVSYSEIDLGWTGSTDSGTGVSGYRIFRQGPGESSFTQLATTTGTGAGRNSYVDSTVKPNSTYSYYVTAYDGANNVSSPSNTIAVTSPAGPASQTYTFIASGDATIEQANPTVTGGGTSLLVIDNNPVQDALLKFNVVTTGCETLTSAKLSLANDANGSVKGGDFYTTGPFNESTVSWNNAPTRGTLLNSLAAVASNASVSVDVTQGTPLNGEADFRVGSTSGDGVRYFSREGTGGKPTLTVICSAAQVPDNTAPSTPANLRSTSNASGEVGLAWDASTDNLAVSEYHIYRGGTQIGIVPASSLTYQDTTVAPSTSYSYTVRAFDAAGNSSSDSNPVTVTTPAGTSPPAPPTNLSATPSSTSVALSWTASSNTTVTGYNIYRAPHGQPLVRLDSSGGTSYTDSTVAAGTYDYGVTAVSMGGSESAAATVTVTVGSASQTYTFTSAGDATIDNTATNYGTSPKLVVDNSPVNDFLLKFTVATTGCTTVSQATLRLVDKAEASTMGGDIYTTGTFNESTVNATTPPPARGTKITSLGPVVSGQTYTLDVTAGVTTVNGEVDLRAGSPVSDGANYYSKEGAGTTTARIPTLIVVCS
ncbi:MAG: fibronectin type III domain-containing protein [Jatrophihabitantaceae bacterium]